MARRHLAIFLKGIAEKILSSEKKVELRLSQSKIIPYLAVRKDDIILLKITGGKIIGEATVDNVLYYDNINKEIFDKIRNQYFTPAAMSDAFWNSKRKSRYATIILLKNPKKYLTAVPFEKNDRRAWVVLNNDTR